MICKIDATERDTFEASCNRFGAKARFYTIESNPLLLQVEILDRGKEITLLTAYLIGRDTGMEKLNYLINK